jgi:hypothetical protein
MICEIALPITINARVLIRRFDMSRPFHPGFPVPIISRALVFTIFLSGFIFGTNLAHANTTQVLFVGKGGIREMSGSFDFSDRNIIHYNQFSLDITKDKPYRDGMGRALVIPDTPEYKGISEVTYHFWHPRNERRLLDAIIVKAYDEKGRLIKHGAFDRGVFVVILSEDLFHGDWVEFQDVGRFVHGDSSLYVKVLLRKRNRIALVPFTLFLEDFTKKINTVPVASWAVK